ncbi:unnamed protein product [Tetraodon nigroviridis]|uniref:(spotted green pufferfish) hypothetical protein n=1 Tax=Tetraodon nigroviridis TaxID=99883 RepID=Q4SJM7_TETNG|nr:unnamed protein product [Tetraodon nigroviridis]
MHSLCHMGRPTGAQRVGMEMERGHMSIKRGVSWSPGGLRKPFSATQTTHTPGTDCSAPWERAGFNKDEMSRKANLTRSASLSEKELKEARVRSQIIAAQLTVPSNSSSRGVQLFNRRKQRVDAFTRKSCGERSDEDKREDVKINPTSINIASTERNSKGTDRGPNFKNSTTPPHLAHPGTSRHLTGTDVADRGEEFCKREDMDVLQERHFLPVKEEEDETENKIHQESEVKDEIAPESSNADEDVEIKGTDTGPVLPEKVNGCPSASEPETVSVFTSKHTSTIINRTARPFLSPLTVHSPEPVCPIMDIHPPPSYDTPPLPAFTAPQPLAFSPPPPPPSYPTPPLPAFTNQPPQTYCSSSPPVSPVTPLSSPPAPEFPASILSQYPPMPNYGPPKPQSAAEKRSTTPIKTGVLEEGAARRASKKSMFTFKEKPVVSPNPELLLLVQGVDERKKHGHKPVPEPACEEEFLALGAEASNFLAKEEAQVENAKAPEWVSCLRSSRTQPRPEHKLEQTLINVSGKGAELFAKRQSRMEKYVLEGQKGQIRSPSPTMSLPPSWVYPSTMPGRVKAIVRNSDVSAQLSQNLQAQQAVKQKPKQKAKTPEPAAEPPAENGCSKIEMELSSHRPYQIDSSLFFLKPVKDPISTLPRGAPQYRNPPTQAFSRQASLPNSSSLNFRTQCTSPQLHLNSARERGETVPHPGSGPPRSSSAMSASPPERASSSRSGVQAPRPTFSATKAGIVPQDSPRPDCPAPPLSPCTHPLSPLPSTHQKTAAACRLSPITWTLKPTIGSWPRTSSTQPSGKTAPHLDP